MTYRLGLHKGCPRVNSKGGSPKPEEPPSWFRKVLEAVFMFAVYIIGMLRKR